MLARLQKVWRKGFHITLKLELIVIPRIMRLMLLLKMQVYKLKGFNNTSILEWKRSCLNISKAANKSLERTGDAGGLSIVGARWQK